MNFAVKIDTGVTQMTTRVTAGFNLNINTSVSTIVSTPEKSCWKVSVRPFENWSMSVTTRFTMSPWRCESM